jgi:hypothetical protein
LNRNIYSVDDWLRKSNLTVSGFAEFPHKSYFYALKIEYFIGMKMRADPMNCDMDSTSRFGRRGCRPIILSRIRRYM